MRSSCRRVRPEQQRIDALALDQAPEDLDLRLHASGGGDDDLVAAVVHHLVHAHQHVEEERVCERGLRRRQHETDGVGGLPAQPPRHRIWGEAEPLGRLQHALARLRTHILPAVQRLRHRADGEGSASRPVPGCSCQPVSAAVAAVSGILSKTISANTS